MARLPLSLALSDNPNTRPLIDGAVKAEHEKWGPIVAKLWLKEE